MLLKSLLLWMADPETYWNGIPSQPAPSSVRSPCTGCPGPSCPSRPLQIKQTPPLTLSFEPNSAKMNWESCLNRPTGIPAENLGLVVPGRDAQSSTSTAQLCLPAQHWAGAVHSLPLHTAQQLCTKTTSSWARKNKFPHFSTRVCIYVWQGNF